MPKTALGLALLAALAACGDAPEAAGGQTPLEALRPCGRAPEPGRGWRRVDDWGSHFQLPPAFSEENYLRTDSHTRRFSAPGRRLALEYGPWAPGLREFSDIHAGARDIVECRATIGSRPARVVTARLRNDSLVAAATWRNEVDRNHLTLYGIAADRAGRRELEAVLHSVRFDPRSQPPVPPRVPDNEP